MRPVTFVSSNQNKFREVQSILSAYGISVNFERANLLEIQSDSLEQIAREKAENAFSLVKKPVIVEDDGLFIESLRGFPGQYSSHAFNTLGNTGVLRLLEGSSERSAFFKSLIAFCDGMREIIFEGKIEGCISNKITEGGWGYDPIFVPAGSDLTFAQLKEKKSDYSHRKKALNGFAEWHSTE